MINPSPAISGKHTSLVHRTLLLAACALALQSTSAHALPISAGGGYDYYTDHANETSRAALAFAGVGLLGWDVFVAGMRYDNDVVGEGNGVSVGAGFPVFPMTQLRATVTRFAGDESYRAWRIKTGPQFRIPTGQTLGVFYSHDQSNVAPRVHGILAEAGVPLLAGLRARATAGYARSSEGDQSALGSVGMNWSMVRFIELSGEVGLTQNTRVGSGQPVPLSRRPPLPILGGGGSSGEQGADEPTSAVTTLLGIRITFP
jgi:hypothetical protein